MKILLTGSGGFTGTFLKNFLTKEKAEIFTIGTKNFPNKRHFKISQNFSIEEIKKVILDICPDYIFHLAGSPMGNSENFLEDLNFKFAKNIILSSKALDKEVRIILLGSAAEYGIVKPNDLPIKETLKPIPYNAYGKTKLKQTEFALENHTSNCKILVLRPFNLFGPGMPNFLALGNFANQINEFKKNSNHSKNFILKTGNIDVSRDYIFIEDFVEIMWLLSQQKKNYGKIFNVCSGESRNIKKILIKMISNSRLKIDLIEEDSRLRNNDIKDHYGCNKKMISSLGSYGFTEFEDSIKKLV
jgi:GDP-4-dehydro-6-deoxy-D-mannose reductase